MTTVLFVHGILGKPDYFDFLRPYVAEAGFRSEDILLEGHCDTPRAFGRASMERWRGQVAEAAARLHGAGSSLIIAAHSMGTLFAIDNAVRGMADCLFLLNPPLKLRPTRRMFTSPLKVLAGRTADRWSAAAKAAYSISDDQNPLHYLGWIPRYLELFAEIRRTRPLARQLALPAHVYLSAHDEMVSPRSAGYFPDRPDTNVTILPDSGHYYYAGTDRGRIEADFARFVALFA